MVLVKRKQGTLHFCGWKAEALHTGPWTLPPKTSWDPLSIVGRLSSKLAS